MRVVEEVRRERLVMLLEEYGGAANLNAKLGRVRTDSTFSQIVNQSIGSKTAKPKTMGSPLARELERECGKPVGWMDTDPSIWPFEDIDQGKLGELTPRQIAQLEGAMLSVAAQLGLDIEKRAA